MSVKTNSSSIAISVDPTNPGQFFACCGIFEIANRIAGDCHAYFSSDQCSFSVYSPSTAITLETILDGLRHAKIKNMMPPGQLERLRELRSLTTKQTNAAEKAERKFLEAVNRKSEIVIDDLRGMVVDWFADTRSGGSRFKTWAGQQSVLEITTEMQRLIADDAYHCANGSSLFSIAVGDSIGFNFDAALGSHSSAIDVGFVLDPLGMTCKLRPAIELLAFIGLQRFRPSAVGGKSNCYAYATWARPENIFAASSKSTALVPTSDVNRYEFSMLYRTKYLKSFLPAEPSE